MENIGKYRIEAKIGQGAMGFVYKAWHPGFNDYVALKTIQDSRLEGHELLERFRVEGQALAKLKHQNIVQIYDADQAEGIHFIVMEYMNGPGLDQLIERREDISLARKVGYIVPVCQALDYAHKRRLFHRDIKPANIMLQHDGNEEFVKVVDFGIARLLDFSKTSTNLFIGAPAYMAPELLTAVEKANDKTDIWALGVTFYELIAYRRPFEGTSLEDLKSKIVNCAPQPISQFNSDCPQDLEMVILRMLEKDPCSRYQMIEDLLLDLEPIAKRLGSEAAVTLVRRAEELYEIGELETARSTLGEARKYDPTNTNIKNLLQKIQDDLHRKELSPRLQGHLKRGRELLQAASFREARGEAEAAIGLDSRFEPAHKLLQEVEQAVARVQLLEQKIRLTKRRLSEGALTQAEEVLHEAEQLDIGNPQLRELKRQIEEEHLRREKRKRVNQVLNHARALLAGLDYEECLAEIAEGLKEFPGDTDLRKLQENARAELAELEKQRAKQRAIGESRALIGQEDFAGALSKIEQLSRQYPQDVGIKKLESLALDGARQQKRRKRLAAGWKELHDLLATGSYREAAIRGQLLLRDYPQENELRDLVNYAIAETNQGEPGQQQAGGENNIPEPLKANECSAAEMAAQVPYSTGAEGGTATVMVPEKPEAERSPLPVAYTYREDALGAVEKHLANLIGPIASIIVKRAASQTKDPKQLLAVLASKLPTETDRKQFLGREHELLGILENKESMGKSPPAGTETETLIDASSVVLTATDIKQGSDLLARRVGPISRVLAARATKRADTLRSFYLILAEHIEDRNERAIFLAEAGFPES
ncbi:MAG: protein kinase [Candidatus Acidiferrum sp.]